MVSRLNKKFADQLVELELRKSPDCLELILKNQFILQTEMEEFPKQDSSFESIHVMRSHKLNIEQREVIVG